MGNMSSFVDNIPIVWVVKKIIGPDSGNIPSIPTSALPDNPIIFRPKEGPMREIPQVRVISKSIIKKCINDPKKCVRC